MKYSPRFTYTFTPSTKTLDLSSNSGFNVKGLLAVIDVTLNTLIFAQSSSGLGYSAISGGNILTLSYDTTTGGFASGDLLNFIYDDGISANSVANSSAPTPVTSGSHVDSWSDQFGRQVISDLDPEWNLAGGMTALRDKIYAQRYTVLADSIADGLATFWTQTTASGGTITLVSGEGLLQTSTATTGSAQLSSTSTWYLPGQVAWLNSAIRFSDTGVAGNIRRIGAFTVSGTTPQDGFYYELNGTTLNAVSVKAGVTTTTAVGSWSRVVAAPFTLDTNYHQFEIRWTSNRADFLIDNVLRHTASGGSTTITSTLTFPMTVQSINTSAATNEIIAIRNIGIGRFGNPGGVVTETGTAAVEALAVGGGTPHASTDSGNPLKLGGYAKTTAPTAVSDGQRVNAWFSPTGALNVTGTFYQATQPVSIASMPNTPVTGTFWQTTQPVSIASMPSTPVTGTFWQATQPISGTVTATQGATGTAAAAWFARITDGTNFMPTMDVAARRGYHSITDGTNTASVKPASTPAVVGDSALVTIPHPSGITYVQGVQSSNTTGSITTATSIVGPLTVTSFNVVTVGIYGTYAGVTAVFEASPDGTNWFLVQGSRVDNAVVGTGVTLATNLTTAWDIPIGAWAQFRVRATAWTSGTASIFMGAQTLPYDPAPGAIAQGDVASGITNSGSNPLKNGGIARITNPTAVTDGQRVSAIFDKLGKQVVVGAIRDRKARQVTTITAVTETTIITAGAAGVFNDIYGLIITNISATTVYVTIKEATAGTTVMIIEVPSTDTRGMMLPVDSAIPQTTAANNWTATLSAAVTSINITALYVQNI